MLFRFCVIIWLFFIWFTGTSKWLVGIGPEIGTSQMIVSRISYSVSRGTLNPTLPIYLSVLMLIIYTKTYAVQINCAEFQINVTT